MAYERPIFGIQVDILTKIQTSGRNNHLEPSGKNESNLATRLVPKVNSDSFLISYLEFTLTSG